MGEMKIARYYEEGHRYLVKCNLCPHFCTIGDGKTGKCQVRKNSKGELYAEAYGLVSSMGFDPIEKKPLYHFFPGNDIFSIGSYGCNLKCRFCQNWNISQNIPVDPESRKRFSPEGLVGMAVGKKSNIGIAFTYNEPAVWFEFMLDIAKNSKKKKLKNVMVTNGFINPEPLEELFDYIDAFNVDLKAFSEDFYHTQTLSKLAPVKDNLIRIRRKGKHLEITNLVITGQNDDSGKFREMVKWIAGELGEDTVLHISRYFPVYKMSAPPTSVETLQDFYDIAIEILHYVYMGNISSANGQNTNCPGCGKKVIDRSRYDTWVSGLDSYGKCSKCGYQVLDNI